MIRSFCSLTFLSKKAKGLLFLKDNIKDGKAWDRGKTRDSGGRGVAGSRVKGGPRHRQRLRHEKSRRERELQE